MANFHTHASVSIGVSAMASAMLHISGVIGSSLSISLILLGSIGGLLPDIDSDHSTSIRVIFNLLSIIGATVTMIVAGNHFGIIPGIGFGILFFFCLRYVVFYVFTKITSHRGIFHSVPMAIIFGLVTTNIVWYFLNYPAKAAWLAGLFVTMAFLLHLILDELYSVDLSGGRMKRSFLTAFKFIQYDRWKIYFFLYIAIGLLLLFTPPFSILLDNIFTMATAHSLWSHRWN